jgi:hypothetical protein
MTDQLPLDHLQHMTAEEISAAYDDGRLDVSLGALDPTDAQIRHRARTGGPITTAELNRLGELGEHEIVATLDHSSIID